MGRSGSVAGRRWRAEEVDGPRMESGGGEPGAGPVVDRGRRSRRARSRLPRPWSWSCVARRFGVARMLVVGRFGVRRRRIGPVSQPDPARLVSAAAFFAFAGAGLRCPAAPQGGAAADDEPARGHGRCAAVTPPRGERGLSAARGSAGDLLDLNRAPAVITAAVTTPATALVPIAPPTAPSRRRAAAAAAPRRSLPPPAPARRHRRPRPAPAPPAACAAEAELGEREALEREQRADRDERRQRLGVGAQLAAEVVALLALATWRRTGPETLRSPSAASASSSRTSPQVSWRAWVASASEIRARTSSDLTPGTVVSIAWAISS